MPWKELNVLDLRKEFVNRALTEKIPFSSLCDEFGISRKTGYKWKERFLENGYHGLADESRRPSNSPTGLPEDMIVHIVRLRNAHPTWGAKKIKHLLENSFGISQAPSESSINRILDKAGLVKKKKVKRFKELNKSAFRNMIEPTEPNDVWTVDFKGWWYSSCKEKCLPLTIRDLKSKYIFEVRLMHDQGTAGTKAVFERLFKIYGLPRVIRSDNGSPFAAANSPLGLSKLTAWWMLHGIIPDRILPGKPYQNGSHERMHRDIKWEIQNARRGQHSFYQAALDEWRHEYNHVRPHETLGMQTPSQVYTLSPRKYEGEIDEIFYPSNFERRKVNTNGDIVLNNNLVRITSAFDGYHVGLYYENDTTMTVWYSSFFIGEIDLLTYKFYTQPRG